MMLFVSFLWLDRGQPVQGETRCLPKVESQRRILVEMEMLGLSSVRC